MWACLWWHVQHMLLRATPNHCPMPSTSVCTPMSPRQWIHSIGNWATFLNFFLKVIFPCLFWDRLFSPCWPWFPSVAEDDLELPLFLPLPLKSWNYWHDPCYSVYAVLGIVPYMLSKLFSDWAMGPGWLSKLRDMFPNQITWVQPWDLRDRRREQTPASFLLTSTHVPWNTNPLTHRHTHMNTHTYAKM